jgi:hypothetical protein
VLLLIPPCSNTIIGRFFLRFVPFLAIHTHVLWPFKLMVVTKTIVFGQPGKIGLYP